MRRCLILIIPFFLVAALAFRIGDQSSYQSLYYKNLDAFTAVQNEVHGLIRKSNLSDPKTRGIIKKEIARARRKLKSLDFWFRYLEPTVYKRINGPLQVEWESEVFEKYEKPHKREGSGYTLAEIYLGEENIKRDSLLALLEFAISATETYKQYSIVGNLEDKDAFFLCNRLYLLNLATIYTSGFECPEPERIVPELQNLLSDVKDIYKVYNESFPEFPLTEKYLLQYDRMIAFVKEQPADLEKFDHFRFIRDHVNPLFALNQQYVRTYKIKSKNFNDYTLDNSASSIFSKSLFFAQDIKGIYSGIRDPKVLAEIDSIGKYLFYDPILSGNNLRSCVSCHKPEQCFTDTAVAASLQYNQKDLLPRNSPSLINTPYNHLLMLDGKLHTLTQQAHAVMTNPIEMGSKEEEVLEKVMSCKTYKKAFTKFLKYTPGQKEVTMQHIASAITLYYGKFSQYYSPFDEAMNGGKVPEEDVIKGFNLFMGKAQCATCHFIPQFNGIKPPYIGNEFEVIGVPKDSAFSSLSVDKGRYEVNAAGETMNAFRTTTVRNAAYTKPYMHNGIFKTLEEVVDFYDGGGGAGRSLTVNNQTLAADSLHLTKEEKKQLISFINSLNENIKCDIPPVKLPLSKRKELNGRKVGGVY